MFIKKSKFDKLMKSIDNLNTLLLKNNLIDLSEILGNRKELLIRNLLSGMFKGIGIGIGVTLITAVLIFLLQKLVTLNIPVIGEFVSDIVDIVQQKK